MEFFGPFLISLIAGLSTCLGYLLTYIKTKNINNYLTVSLSFACGVMLLISVKELIPIPLKYIILSYSKPLNIIILVFIPFIAYLIFKTTNKAIKTDNSLYRVGLLSMITLLLHNIPEGMATFMAASTNTLLGLKLGVAIMAHNIPEGICISVPIYYATKNRGKAFLYTFIAAIAEPIGAILMYTIFKEYISINILNIILYFIGSLMISICLLEIIPEIRKYHCLSGVLYGLILSLFILLL
jgi:zinc transporter, ZIP family